MDVRTAIQAYFGICTSGILIAYCIPALSSRYLAYGPRISSGIQNDGSYEPMTLDELAGLIPRDGIALDSLMRNDRVRATPELEKMLGSICNRDKDTKMLTPKHPSSYDQLAKQSKHSGLLDLLAAIRVPHGWFRHFYYVSTLSSVLWAYQLFTRGNLVNLLLAHESVSSSHSMSSRQIVLTWALMATQGIRRLCECIVMTTSSASEMWVLHWLLGISFYGIMGIAVWIEGSPILYSEGVQFKDLRLQAPSFRTILALPIFILASGIQHDCHIHLSSLKKYSRPTHPVFQQIICPHYFAECLVYLSLSIIAAPRGDIVNKTIFTAFLFVTINLGITAEITRQWTALRFGEKSVQGRWRMIPYIW